MRLIIIAVVCSLLVVGGFFGYKQYQRSEMKQDARAYVMSTIQRSSQSFGADAEARLVEFSNDLFDETFRDHYKSGGLSSPAQFSDVEFSRDLFERIYNASQTEDLPEETRQLARRLYVHSQPMRPGSFGAVPDEGTPDPPSESPDDDGGDPDGSS